VKAVYPGVEGVGVRRSAVDAKIGEMVGEQGEKLSRWDAEREIFVGNGIAWVTKHCAPVRQTPDAKGTVVTTPWEHEVVMLLPERQGEWQKVKYHNNDVGWMNRNHLSLTSPTRVFR
jgi:hypothetical protein